MLQTNIKTTYQAASYLVQLRILVSAQLALIVFMVILILFNSIGSLLVNVLTIFVIIYIYSYIFSLVVIKALKYTKPGKVLVFQRLGGLIALYPVLAQSLQIIIGTKNVPSATSPEWSDIAMGNENKK